MMIYKKRVLAMKLKFGNPDFKTQSCKVFSDLGFAKKQKNLMRAFLCLSEGRHPKIKASFFWKFSKNGGGGKSFEVVLFSPI